MNDKVAPIQPAPYAYEEQFVVRFPPNLASMIREDLRSDNPDSLSSISIDFPNAAEPRLATVTVRARAYQAVLLDLPNILETMRPGVDSSQFYKVADVSQILLVLDDSSSHKASAYASFNYQSTSGITPLLQCRQRLQRPTQSISQQVQELEAAVNSLIERDSRAVRSTFTLYDGSTIVMRGGTEESSESDATLMEGTDTQGISAMQSEVETIPDAEFAHDESEEDVGFYSEEEEAKDYALDESDVDDLAAEIEENLMQQGELSLAPSPTLKSPEEYMEITDLKQQLETKRIQLSYISNPIIRKRFEETMAQLEAELAEKMQSKDAA